MCISNNMKILYGIKLIIMKEVASPLRRTALPSSHTVSAAGFIRWAWAAGAVRACARDPESQGLLWAPTCLTTWWRGRARPTFIGTAEMSQREAAFRTRASSAFVTIKKYLLSDDVINSNLKNLTLNKLILLNFKFNEIIIFKITPNWPIKSVWSETEYPSCLV